MKKITTRISILTLSILNIINFIPVYAINCSDGKIPNEVKRASGCNGTGDDLPISIVNILNAIIGTAGLIAVIFIIIGGINYMTSSGEAAKVKKAKDTILYACIGLAVCILSFAIVNFVIANIIGGK